MGRMLVVRYQTRPERADENAGLVAAVYRELAELDPGDFRYVTYRLADGVTFVHIADQLGPVNPLSGLAAFTQFQQELAERCAEQPQLSQATVVGSYGWDTPAG